MNARDEILGRLRRAGFDAPLPAVPARRVGPGGADAAERFMERARAADIDVVRVPDLGSLPEQVGRVLARAGARTVTMWDDPLLRPVADALRREGLVITDDPAQADAGITTVDAAVAETATLALGAGPGRPGSVSLLPPLHLAVLPEGRIVATVSELWPSVNGPPSALWLITGPSRTADIEHTPVRGAHGPVAVTVFLVGI
ncbi:MAG: LUD domain-containing protein [Armatimonadota bacterium]|nr:LUD domain-containing protein [Armatimonadota bacterium]MDR7452698.1 LUD domain-containing protein [Armatimonadota bacterium]MDR7467303.1 LUD domain-containing protein [Armatimonadota bacterium]MDR7494564.1 LUD domain-containing protein [Armatimonadota bacterium]MDR7504469.1 LUD domain-containing protein [Armatimonadota bacterium]